MFYPVKGWKGAEANLCSIATELGNRPKLSKNTNNNIALNYLDVGLIKFVKSIKTKDG